MGPYLDCNATTPVDARVLAAMQPWFCAMYGNASSRDHAFGWDAAEAVEEARVQVSEAAHARPSEVVITSGATEGLNAVLRSYLESDRRSRKRIVTSASEHDAVLTPARYLCRRANVELEILPVDRCGGLNLERLAAALSTAPGALVALMAANNEIGTIHPIRSISDIVHASKGLFICDTTQAFGKRPVDILNEGIDFATISAHKIHGPKGAGAILRREEVEDELEPLILGGGQERGVRGGTLNIPGIVGCGEACRLVQEHLDEDVKRMRCLRDRLEEEILSQVPNTWINGDRENRLCNTSNVGFKGIDARMMIRDMHDIAVSTRSACSTGKSGPSHVLKAIGLSDEDAYSCIRFSLGRFTTEEEIDYTIDKVVTSADKLRRNKSLRR